MDVRKLSSNLVPTEVYERQLFIRRFGRLKLTRKCCLCKSMRICDHREPELIDLYIPKLGVA